jgi:hypothetical protein
MMPDHMHSLEGTDKWLQVLLDFPKIRMDICGVLDCGEIGRLDWLVDLLVKLGDVRNQANRGLERVMVMLEVFRSKSSVKR